MSQINEFVIKEMLHSLIIAVDSYRLEHSMHEAGESRSEYNDTYVTMLQTCDAIKNDLQQSRAAELPLEPLTIRSDTICKHCGHPVLIQGKIWCQNCYEPYHP